MNPTVALQSGTSDRVDGECYVEGENIAIDYRYADGKLDQRAQLLAELIRLNIDIIVTHSTETVLAQS